MKSVRNECQGSLPQSTSTDVLRPANAYPTTVRMMEVKNFLAEYSQEMRRGSVTTNPIKTAKYEVQTTDITTEEEI